MLARGAARQRTDTTMNLFGIIPTHDPNQALRIKRFLMAGLVYAMAVGLMWLFVLEGLMPLRGWTATTAAIVATNLIFYLILRTGRNERLGDPSLTGLQMLAACLLMTLTMYEVNAGRGALLLLYMVLFMFGVFRLRTWQFMSLGLFALFCYGGAIAAVQHYRPWAVDIRLELLQLAALAAIVPCGSFFAGYVGRMRRLLRERQIQLQQALETAHELNVQDELTGVNNRRSIFEFLEHEVGRAQRVESPLALLLLDLDRFQAINRDYGYTAGDRVLEIVAEKLRQSVRAVDGLGRSGGEEFLIIMPDTTADTAASISERLRDRVERCRIQEMDPMAKLTLSIGVTQFRSGDNSAAMLDRARHAADAALDKGGNRVVVEGAGEENAAVPPAQ
ncbi:MAG: diguanylate cyclase [Ectothiorhodospiraceae bacterium]